MQKNGRFWAIDDQANAGWAPAMVGGDSRRRLQQAPVLSVRWPRVAGERRFFPNLDGIVPIAHTEGSGYTQINNRDYPDMHSGRTDLSIRMWQQSWWLTYPRKQRRMVVTNQTLQGLCRSRAIRWPLSCTTFSPSPAIGKPIWHKGTAIARQWLPVVNAMLRTPESLAHLAVALQCGGSDAFSGISGNPLASSVAKELIRYGGQANLAETDELDGPEAYVLQNVRDLATAAQFCTLSPSFRSGWSRWANGRGQSVRRQQSLRGLYNIALKSIGAAMKRHPDVRLDYVIDYGERMGQPGFYFMNSPGNDLESIAGQVASSANLIIFITGNGSITNFPFVPTIKVMTTSSRYALLPNEMDVNAGAYLDGVSMEALTQETLDLLVEIASGRQSRGEVAGHSQISIWRNWQQQDRSRLPLILEREKPDGQPLPFALDAAQGDTILPLPPPIREAAGRGSVGLILPTSLCSGQIARLATNRLNALAQGKSPASARYATLVHTEGCGVAFASTREIYAETMVGYAVHPLVGDCLFLEHGCEKAHNNYLQSLLQARGLALDTFGWASVQLDGGIDNVLAKISDYFSRSQAHQRPTHKRAQQPFSVALLADDDLPAAVAVSLAPIIGSVVSAGGTVVLPSDNSLAKSPALRQCLGFAAEPKPSLAYGQTVPVPGFHLMETPTPHWTETITGLGATGADLIIAYTKQLRPGHPFVPVLLLGDANARYTPDLCLQGDAADWPAQLVALMAAVMAGEKRPTTIRQNNIDFQLTRGWLGIST
ncbi:MAG: UxaA family hydrolase [Caldilineaceae bacterium]